MSYAEIDYPVSVLDFIFETEKMSESEFVVFAETIKLKLKKLPTEKGNELYYLGCEIEHLIDFIHKVCYYLTYRKTPGGLQDYDEPLYQKVIARYPLKD